MAGRGRAAAGADRPAHGLEHRRRAPSGSRMFAGVEGERFYFVHSYGVRTWALETHGRTAAPLVTWTETVIAGAGDRFVAAVENGPLWATQFHPEKSGDAGAAAAPELGGEPVSDFWTVGIVRDVWWVEHGCTHTSVTDYPDGRSAMSKERQQRRAEREAAAAALPQQRAAEAEKRARRRRAEAEADRLAAQGAGPPDRAAGREAAPPGGRDLRRPRRAEPAGLRVHPGLVPDRLHRWSPACSARRSCT